MDVFTAETLCDIFQLYFCCSSCISFLFFVSPHCLLVTVHGCGTLSLSFTQLHTHAHRHSIGFYVKLGVCSHNPQPSEGRQDDERLWHLPWQMPSLSFPHVHVCSKCECGHGLQTFITKKPNKWISEPCSLAEFIAVSVKGVKDTFSQWSGLLYFVKLHTWACTGDQRS